MESSEMRPVCRQSGSELLTTLDALHTEETLRQTYRLQVIARLDEIGHAQELGARDTTELIAVRHRLNRTDVTRDLKLAHDLPKYPAVTAALPNPYTPTNPGDLASADTEDIDGEDIDGEGEPGPVTLNLGQAAAIVTALNKVPNTVPVEDLQVAEEQMVEAARHLSPGDLRVLGQQVVDTLDTDGAEPAEDQAYQREALWLRPVDHRMKFGGFLAAEHAELFKTAIHGLSKPHKTVDGDLDPRPREKRRADALVTIPDSIPAPPKRLALTASQKGPETPVAAALVALALGVAQGTSLYLGYSPQGGGEGFLGCWT